MILLGCKPGLLEQAFQGKLTSQENNKIITEYCQSCHVHSNFYPDNHVREVSKKYKEEQYKNALSCNACHYLKKNFFSEPSRLTKKP